MWTYTQHKPFLEKYVDDIVQTKTQNGKTRIMINIKRNVSQFTIYFTIYYS